MTKATAKTTDTPEIVEKIALPVGILIKGKRYNKVELRPISLGQSYDASMNARETDLQVLVDLSVMTYVPELERSLTYDELHSASRQDGSKLEVARIVLEKKEREQATVSA